MKILNRTFCSLDGIWNFSFQEGGALPEKFPRNLTFPDVMAVPAAFDTTPRYLRKRGLACYEKSFYLEREWKGGGLLRIGALGLSGRVWLDGKKLGEAPIAYNQYEFETPALAAGTHSLLIAVDNRLDDTTPFFKPNYDFYGFGGIYRSVSLEELPDQPVVLDRIQVRTTDWRKREVELRVLFRAPLTSPVRLSLRFDTEEKPRVVRLLPEAGEGESCAAKPLRLTVPRGALWSLETPRLHVLYASLAGSGETLCEEFGIREFKAEKNHFSLNGKRVWLYGFNRHESHPECGPAVPESVMLEDLHHLKEMGCNFIRGAHYPQDERFLALCDRMGFLVWEEGLAWGNTEKDLSDPVFREGQKDQMRRMVRKSVNHPSVVIWAFLNEFDSGSDAGVSLCAELVDVLHTEDASRPVSFACNRGQWDRCVPLVDIAAYNTYPGWIGAPECREPEEKILADRDHLVSVFKKTKKRGAPILISEMGCCGVYGQRDDAAAQWTEEFQARYLAAVQEAARSCPDICGLCIWQLTDCLSFHRMGGEIRTKPFAQNLAGVFDAFRRRKLSAAVCDFKK